MTETEPGRDETHDDQEIARHREGEHRAGVPERRDDSEVEAGETGPGLEGIDALPEDDGGSSGR